MLLNEAIMKTNVWRAELITEKSRKLPAGRGLEYLGLKLKSVNALE